MRRPSLGSFLRWLLAHWRAYFQRDTFQQPLQQREPLARFITDPKNIKADGVSPRVFLPPSDQRTSVCRIIGLVESEVWKIADEWITNVSSREVVGRVLVTPMAVVEAGLGVDPDNNPPRHASIIGWPEPKDARLSMAQRLAAKAGVPVRRLPRPPTTTP